jgi:hypothetical protein
LRPSGFDIAAHEGYEVLCRANCTGFNFGIPARLIHRHHRVRPCEQLSGHIVRDAKQTRDNNYGQLITELCNQIKWFG